jgi:hypothetical protein
LIIPCVPLRPLRLNYLLYTRTFTQASAEIFPPPGNVNLCPGDNPTYGAIFTLAHALLPEGALMNALNRKLIHDLFHLRGQVAAVALVTACGIAAFVALRSAIRSRR